MTHILVKFLADILTYEEHRGPISGKIFAWMGDGNNVLHSLIEVTALFNFHLRIATPKDSEPQMKYVEWSRERDTHLRLLTIPKKLQKMLIVLLLIYMGFHETRISFS